MMIVKSKKGIHTLRNAQALRPFKPVGKAVDLSAFIRPVTTTYSAKESK